MIKIPHPSLSHVKSLTLNVDNTISIISKDIELTNGQTNTECNLKFDMSKASGPGYTRLQTVLRDIEGQLYKKIECELEPWDHIMLKILPHILDSWSLIESKEYINQLSIKQLFCCWCCLLFFIEQILDKEDMDNDEFCDYTIYQNILKDLKLKLIEKNSNKNGKLI